ncbi:MAG: glutamyl-tRNA reductase [Acidobacteria bacterium]|nr:glutamyl-tRNA reductase [Acidobacteriota bacterium]
MGLVLVGLNHETAPVRLREKVGLNPEEVDNVLRELIQEELFRELVILSTCNRTELIAMAAGDDAGEERLVSFLAERAEVPVSEIREHVYVFWGLKAVEHVFRVASGLESMVLGEPQITGQVKDAFDRAISAGTAGSRLSSIYRHTVQTVKQVRTQTEIAKSAVSVSYVAVELARKVFGELKGKRALLVGAGEMCELAATHLKERGVDAVDVANRTLERAEKLAVRFNGNPFSLENIKEALSAADIVVSSTGSPDPVIGRAELEAVLRKRKSASLLLIDIAVPRDIEPEAGDLPGVFLFDIDDLQKVIEANMEKRKKEAEKAAVLIAKRVREYEKWRRMQDVNPMIVELRRSVEAMRKEELEKSLKHLHGCSDEVKKELDRLSCSIMNKMLHQPITELKRAAREENLEGGLVSFFKSIFKLN